MCIFCKALCGYTKHLRSAALYKCHRVYICALTCSSFALHSSPRNMETMWSSSESMQIHLCMPPASANVQYVSVHMVLVHNYRKTYLKYLHMSYFNFDASFQSSFSVFSSSLFNTRISLDLWWFIETQKSGIKTNFNIYMMNEWNTLHYSVLLPWNPCCN